MKGAYARTGQMLIRPLLFKAEHPAFDLAKLFYAQYPELSFEDDFCDYVRTGFVVCRPNVFLMAKVVQHEGELIWYVRLAIGDLIELIQCMPFYLKAVCFCRNNRAHEMRVVSTQRLWQVAAMIAAKKNVAKATINEGEPKWVAAA